MGSAKGCGFRSLHFSAEPNVSKLSRPPQRWPPGLWVAVYVRTLNHGQGERRQVWLTLRGAGFPRPRTVRSCGALGLYRRTHIGILGTIGREGPRQTLTRAKASPKDVSILQE